MVHRVEFLVADLGPDVDPFITAETFLKTANALGLTVPDKVSAIANEVIE
jgi:hypothetical protein